jgi:hypothetical protein
MKFRLRAVLCLINSLFLLSFSNSAAAFVSEPVLKWQYGGCYSSWCETGWYSSPAVVDLDGDGTQEVIAGAYSVFILNGADGSLRKKIEPAGSRIWPGVVAADLDGDDDIELVTAHGGGYVNVFNHVGAPVWSQQPTSVELRGLSVYDLDNDGTLEVIVNAAVGSKVNTWVYEHDGTLRSGWPQLSDDSGYAYGVFNDNAAIADLDNDGEADIVVPSDVHYICAYRPDGSHILASPIYGDNAWGKIGVWESLAIELRGWGKCSNSDEREERYRTNFAHGAAAIDDLDGDGALEVVVTGNTYDCGLSPYLSRYVGVYIFNPDRSRFQSSGFDWQSVPMDTGVPLSEDYNLIESCQPSPVVADLDGDGQKEILFASYDGRVHAFWLDKIEHGSWPYAVYQSAEEVYRFASEPVVADLDDDNTAEVIFTSWVQKGTGRTGKLHILDYHGSVIHEVDLPLAFDSSDWNGGLAAPTLANIDGDADLEVVINTAHSGVVAYDLPGTANANILWQTGRGSYFRNGATDVPMNSCRVDLDGDGDVDGSDLADLATDRDLLELSIFAETFGRANCQVP